MKYVAFFRGINVGGKNKVKMEDLKQLFSDCGFSDIKTYIQSGNVIFESDKEKTILINIISPAFTEKFGFQCDVILRSKDEISKVMSDLPFTPEEIHEAKDEAPDIEHIYIYFSDGDIAISKLEKVYNDYNGNDKLYIGNQELYLLCYDSIRKSKLAASLARLDTSLTVRNIKTVTKIQELFVK